MEQLLTAQRQTNDALALEALVQKTDAADEARRRLQVRLVVLGLIGGIVMYFVAGIYGLRFRYPHLFDWHDGMRRETTQGQGAHNFSMYHVATAADYTPVSDLLGLFVWTNLSMPGANFLMMCIEFFAKQAATDPKAKLTALHWAGSGEQTQFAKLGGEKGWASGGCSTGTVQEKQQTLVANWNRSEKEGNIWYHLLPKPVDATGTQAFLSIPMIQELFSDSQATGGTADACSASFEISKIGMLFNGGLCYVAFEEGSRSNASAADLFNTFFATHVSVRQSCDGSARAGFVNGAVSTGSAMAFLAPMLEVPGGPYVKGAALLAMTVGGGLIGGVAQQNADRETCQHEDDLYHGVTRAS
jgi:hypothetical protein